MANEIEIVVRAKDQGASNVIDGVGQKAEGFRGTLKRVGETAAGFLSANVFSGAASAALDFFNSSTEAAKDLGENISKVRTVFGQSAPELESWAAGAADALGLSKNAALDAAGGFGNMFTQLGIATDEAAGMSMGMGELAADLASFHNADITEVLDAQAAGFRGEYDALQRFIPTINAATVETRAMQETGKENADELTAQEKALATYHLMLEGAGAATGDFARTSDEAANSERRAKAEMENMSAEIGQKLLPVQMKLTEAKLAFARVLSEKVIPVVEKIVKWFTEHKTVALALAAVIGTILVGAVVAWGIALIAANAPLIAIGLAVGALVYLIVTHWETIKEATLAAFNFVKDIISGVIDWVANNWPLLLAIITGPIGMAVYLIAQHWQTIKDGATAVWQWIVDKFNAVVDFVTGLPGRLASAAAGLWDWIYSGISAAVGFAVDRINDLIRAFNRLPAPDIATIGGGKTGGFVGKAAGGPAGGWTWVGERGPELLRLPAGSGVVPAGQSRQMAAPGGGAGTVVIQVAPGQMGGLEAMFLEWLRNSVRVVGGGDVQAALGWTL